VLSSGEPVLLDTASVPATVQLSRWALTAEHWEAPKDLYDSGTTVKYNTTHELHRLLCWSEISGFSNTSRVGYYTTKFSWPPGSDRAAHSPTKKHSGALLKQSRIIGTRDGHKRPLAPAARYLRVGENTDQVTAPTALWKYLRMILGKLVTAGQPARSETGLVGMYRIRGHSLRTMLRYSEGPRAIFDVCTK
jgi:hypothetical protein